MSEDKISLSIENIKLRLQELENETAVLLMAELAYLAGMDRKEKIIFYKKCKIMVQLPPTPTSSKI